MGCWSLLQVEKRSVRQKELGVSWEKFGKEVRGNIGGGVVIK